MSYLFTSQRLGFRTWKQSDVALMAEINADANVMRYFPSTQNVAETEAFVQRMISMYEKSGYCYFAVDELDTGAFIGFIGIAYQEYDAPFTPCTDVGWRLKQTSWGKGYATEGAAACLEFAFKNNFTDELYSVAPGVNHPSINVMQKIGMKFDLHFNHPKLTEFPALQLCHVYKLNKNDYSQLGSKK